MSSSTVIEELMGPTVFKKSSKGKNQLESVSTSSALKGMDWVLFYFSAHWCPPCQAFTPILADFYKQHAKKEKLEIVYVSSDRNKEEFNNYYFTKMPWLTLDHFNDEKVKYYKTKLELTFKVRGIPCLVVLDAKTGNFITTDGHTDVKVATANKSFPDMIATWKAKPPVSIEEGLALEAMGDGSLWSLIKRALYTLATNPMYLFGTLYLVRQFLAMVVFKDFNNTSPALADPVGVVDTAAHEPIPDDEF